ADDFSRAADCLRGDAEATRVATQVEHALAVAEFGEQFAVLALVDEETGLVLATRRCMELHAVLVDDGWLRCRRSRAVETLLLLHVIFRVGINRAIGEMLEQATADQIALLEHARREVLDHER